MPDDEAVSLEQQQSDLVREYLALKSEAEESATAKGKLGRLGGKIEKIYWQRVEALIDARVGEDSDELAFTPEDRLLIDMGLIDPALVDGAEASLTDRLLEELNMPGAPNHFYLSEWLEDRYQRYRLEQDVAAAAAAGGPDEGDDKSPARARRLAYQKMAPLFKGLPGVPADVADLFIAGGLDDKILQTSVGLLNGGTRREFWQRRRLTNLRTQILEKARARIPDESMLKYFDMIDDVYSRDWRERYQAWENRDAAEDEVTVEETAAEAAAEERHRAVEFLVGELRFVKTLLPLGALAGGVARSRAVLLEDKPRVTKADTARGLALAESCDRAFNVKPVVLIAPFTGRGIFEFDRDSLVISLVPVESAEDSVANAVGNYRMLIDSLQQDGELRKSYEESFPEDNYQQAFQADYRDWVTGVGCGRGDALAADRRTFFRQRIGPDVSGVLAPGNLRNLGPQARAALIKRLEKQISLASNPDANQLHRLGVLYWQENDLAKAGDLLTHAAKLAPGNGMILLSLGLIRRARGEVASATAAFAACKAKAADSIWGVYAADLGTAG